MKSSKKVYTFRLEYHEGHVIITAQEWPWSVLQVVPIAPEHFDSAVDKLRRHGFVAYHDTDRTFAIVHLASGDHDGLHPEHYVSITSQHDAEQYLEALKDAMTQAAVWYKTNIL